MRQDAGYEGTDNYEAINPGDYQLFIKHGKDILLSYSLFDDSGYRLAQTGRIWPGGNINNPPPDVDTELDCWAL